MITHSEIFAAFEVLEIDAKAVNLMRTSRTFEIIRLTFDAIKSEAKLQRRKLGTKYHPDKPDGDEDKMKAVNAAADLIEKIEIKLQRVVVQRVHMVRVHTSASVTNTTSGWTSGSTYYY